MRVVIALLAASMALAGCESPTALPPKSSVPPVVKKDTQPVITPTSRAVTRLELRSGQPRPNFVEDRGWVEVHGYDAAGIELSTDDATITLSDPDAADMARSTMRMTWLGTRDTVRLATAELRYRKAGRFTILVRLESLVGSVDVEVLALPPLSGGVVADSFAVVEIKDVCWADCPYVVYFPVFRIRETTGKGPAALLRVRVDLGGQLMGQCRGEFGVAAGGTRDIAGFDPYLWSNDLLFVSLDGTRIKTDTATAQLIFRDSAGNYGRADVRGPILRIETNPVMPPPFPISWDTC